MPHKYAAWAELPYEIRGTRRPLQQLARLTSILSPDLPLVRPGWKCSKRLPSNP